MLFVRVATSGIHPHQSGGPIANPTLYGGPPVPLSPGQPQQLLPPPFYPPQGVMTFPYPTMYPSPQVHQETARRPKMGDGGRSESDDDDDESLLPAL